MSEERTLGEILQGRTIQSTQNKDGQMTIGFSDGSTMCVGTGFGSSNFASTGGTIRSVEQSETSLHLGLVNGKSLVFPLASANGTILVQDKEGVMEYKGQDKSRALPVKTPRP